MERAEAEAMYDAGRERCVEAIVKLAGRCERLEERVGRVEEQTRQSSRNSSMPPSQDPPKSRKERRAQARAKAKEWAKAQGEGSAPRKAGGQPGHPGSGRKLAPEDQVDEIVDHYPDACGGCGHEFAGSERVPSSRPARHQVSELPPVAVVVTEHRCHRLRCPGCEAKTKGVLPPGVAGSALAPGRGRRS